MNKKLNFIYRKLSKAFGPQNWWPAETPFEVMVGAILTQNTSWGNVEKAIANLKRHKLLSPARLHSLAAKQLARLIMPAGYYNIKAKRLRSFLDFLFARYNGNIRKMSAANTAVLRRQLLSVNGIGPETADSILLYALGKPVFVIDAYTKRILGRHALIKADAGYDEVQGLFMENLKRERPYEIPRRFAPQDEQSKRWKNSAIAQLFNEYHALLVKLAKDFCLKSKPKCNTCPIK